MAMRLRALWMRLLESLWFVPSVVGAAGVLLAVAMVELSARVDPQALERFPRVFGASADSSRSLLSAIAGSVITVAGVTFSLTMVAVTQASAQFTPRVLRTFMRDRPTQVVLGVFVAIFAYCVVVLRTVRSVQESRFVPSIAVVLGIVLALGSMGALIFFVHHIATTLQATHLIERVGRDTLGAIDRLFPEEIAEPAAAPNATVLAALERATWRPVLARATGYVRSVDGGTLVNTAESGDVVVRLAYGVGDFVIAGTPVSWTTRLPRDAGNSSDTSPEAATTDDFERRIARSFEIGTSRTIDQDAAFGVRQLVDIALKALSPGINDTTTAVTCVDWLGAVLVRMANRRVETPFRMKAGVVRVVAAGPTFERLLDLSVDEIRQHADRNVGVLGRVIEMLGRVAAMTEAAPRRVALAGKVRLLAQHAERHVDAAHDRDRIRALVHDALGASDRALDGPNGRRAGPSIRPQPAAPPGER